MAFPYRISTDEENRAAMRRDLFRQKRIEYLLDEEDCPGFERARCLPLMRGITADGFREIVKEGFRLLRHKVKLIGLDVHGTLVARDKCDDFSHAKQFREISKWARSAGLRPMMVPAMPSREGEGVARLLRLLRNPAVYELGHVLTRAVSECNPYTNRAVTPEMEDALDDLRRWLRRDILPRLPGVCREPKVVIVSLNVRAASTNERKWLADQIAGRIQQQKMPLEISQSDATVDVIGVGISKITGLCSVTSDMGLGPIAGQILAVGDSLNDLDLLEAAGPGLLGCPANAYPQVKVFVQERGGVISEYPCLRGTIECLLKILWRNTYGE